jgi:hypothetical protein
MASGVSQNFVQGLRWWAQGALSDEAAVELLARSFRGRYLRSGVAWIRPCARPGWYSLDADALSNYAATQVGDERQVLALAARLVNGDVRTRRPQSSKSGRAAA